MSVENMPPRQRDLVTERVMRALRDYNANYQHPLAGFEEPEIVGEGKILARMDGYWVVIRVEGEEPK